MIRPSLSPNQVSRMNKLRGLAAAVIRDAAEHFLDDSADGTRIATMEFAWAADLLLKLSVMKREGDLVEKQDPKLYKQPLDLLKHLTHELDFDPFKGLKPNVREFFAGLLFGREDGWHRGARLEVEELRISIAGCVPLLEALCRDSGLAFATVAGKEFLEAAGAVKPEPERVEKLIQ